MTAAPGTSVATVALVCDADADTGLGHLSRGVALGEALVDLGAAVTVVGSIDPAFVALVRASGLRLAALADPLGRPGAVPARRAALDHLGADAVVVDSYRIDPDGLAALGSGRTSCAIDDFAQLDRYPTDLVVNFTVGASALPYPDHRGLLLGPAWFLARRDLRRARSTTAARPAEDHVGRVLVAVGGVDRAGIAPRLVRAAAASLGTVAIDVVVGRRGPELPALEDLAASLDRVTVTVGAPSLAPHLAAADLVVCGGGLTKYEAAYLGVPVAVIDQTPDQAHETQEFAARGLAVALGPVDQLDDGDLRTRLGALGADIATRSAMASAGRATFPDDPTDAVARRILGPHLR